MHCNKQKCKGAEKIVFNSIAGKLSEGHGYELEEIWNQKQLQYEGIWWWSHNQRRAEYRSTDTEKHDGETEIEEFFLISDSRGEGHYTVGRVVRLESSGEILGAN